MKKLFATICIALLFQTNLKAQDVKEGWYADGYNVESINCYSFQKLQVVFEYNPEWANYEYLSITIVGPPLMSRPAAKDIKLNVISSFIKSKYFVYTLFGTDNLAIDLMEDRSRFNELAAGPSQFCKGNMKYEASMFGKGKPAEDSWIEVTLYGLNTSVIKEEYDPGCQCIKKRHLYSAIKLGKAYKLVCANRAKGSYKESHELMDITTPCTYPGTNVDFNNLGGKSSSSNNSSSNVTINNTVIVKNEVSTGGTKTTTNKTSATPTAIKPLDKTKPGYFIEKSGNVIDREGYKKGGKLNGEVRIYTDGKLSEITFYVNDEKNGLSTTYHENGKIDMTGTYKNDEKDGEWQKFEEDGKREWTRKYVKGEQQD